MARRIRASRSRPVRPAFAPVRLLLWFLVIVETVWIAGFIWATGTWFPPMQIGSRGRTTTGSRTTWTERKQEELDDLQVQELLARKASRGNSTEPPSPASPR